MTGRRSPIRLTSHEESVLREWAHAAGVDRRIADRARIVLLCQEGLAATEIAALLRTQPARVLRWRRRFEQMRLNGLADTPRSGKPARYDEATDQRIMALLDSAPPDGHTQWNGTLLSKALGDVSPGHIWRTLRRRGIHLQRRRGWVHPARCEFESTAASIIGLYLHPTHKAIAFAVSGDGQPAQLNGDVRLPGRPVALALTEASSDTTGATLTSVLTLAAGLLRTGQFTGRRRHLLEFLQALSRLHSASDIHILLDHPVPYTAAENRWLQTQSRIRLHRLDVDLWPRELHFWLGPHNQPDGDNSSAVHHFCAAIDHFLTSHNGKAAAFEWLIRTH